MIVTLRDRSTITISQELRRALGVKPGDHLEAEVKNGRLVLTPVSVIPRTSALSPYGEKKEAVAEREIKRGRLKRFKTAKALLQDLGE